MITYWKYSYKEVDTKSSRKSSSTLVARLRFRNEVAPNDREKIKNRKRVSNMN